MQKVPNPYDPAQVSDEELLRRYDATVEAARPRSGLYLDMPDRTLATEALFLRGVLLARPKGLKPAWEPFMRVRAAERVSAYDTMWNRSLVLEPSSGTFTIKRVWFCTDAWYLEFVEVGAAGHMGPRYNAAAFEVVSETAKA